jgi:hypothetical protein
VQDVVEYGNPLMIHGSRVGVQEGHRGIGVSLYEYGLGCIEEGDTVSICIAIGVFSLM